MVRSGNDQMDAGILLFLFLIGLIAGTYGTIVGAGGGFIFVPALLLLFHFNPPLAAGAGLVVVFLNSLSGMIGYIREKRIDYRFGILLALAAIPGTFTGVWLFRYVTGHIFYLIFAFMLISLGIFLLVKKEPKAEKQEISVMEREIAVSTTDEQLTAKPASPSYPEGDTSIRRAWWQGAFGLTEVGLVGIGFILGVISSFFGIGGGWLMVPILIYLFRVSPHVATATSVFSLSIYSLVGALSHGIEGNIDWMTVVWSGSGVILGSQLGVYLSRRLPGRLIVQMLAFVLVIVGATMIR